MSAGENEEKQNSDPSDVFDHAKLTAQLLRVLVAKPILSVSEAVFLIQEYIFEKKGERVVITDISNVDLFEKAVTTASNYYGRHK